MCGAYCTKRPLFLNGPKDSKGYILFYYGWTISQKQFWRKLVANQSGKPAEYTSFVAIDYKNSSQLTTVKEWKLFARGSRGENKKLKKGGGREKDRTLVIEKWY